MELKLIDYAPKNLNEWNEFYHSQSEDEKEFLDFVRSALHFIKSKKDCEIYIGAAEKGGKSREDGILELNYFGFFLENLPD